jgi:hypothetical protein
VGVLAKPELAPAIIWAKTTQKSRFNSCRTLRARSATAANGQALSFIQDDKNDGAELRRDSAEGARISKPWSRDL